MRAFERVCAGAGARMCVCVCVHVCVCVCVCVCAVRARTRACIVDHPVILDWYDHCPVLWLIMNR